MEEIALKERLKKEIDELEKKEFHLMIEKGRLVGQFIGIQEKITKNDEDLLVINDLIKGRIKELLNIKM